MTSAKKTYLAVAAGLVAVGVVLAGIGFIASGCNPAVFSTQVDLRGDGAVVLGGVEVDDPKGVPFVSQLAELGEIDASDLAVPGAPEAPVAPTAPAAS